MELDHTINGLIDCYSGLADEQPDVYQKYKLGCAVDKYTLLAEISQRDYAVYGKTFEGEKIFNAPGTSFICNWQSVTIMAVGGTVYKLGYFKDNDDKYIAERELENVLDCCAAYFSVRNKPMRTPSFHFCWDADDGNVIVQPTIVGDVFGLNVILTSRNVRHLKKVRRGLFGLFK